MRLVAASCLNPSRAAPAPTLQDSVTTPMCRLIIHRQGWIPPCPLTLQEPSPVTLGIPILTKASRIQQRPHAAQVLSAMQHTASAPVAQAVLRAPPAPARSSPVAAAPPPPPQAASSAAPTPPSTPAAQLRGSAPLCTILVTRSCTPERLHQPTMHQGPHYMSGRWQHMGMALKQARQLLRMMQ